LVNIFKTVDSLIRRGIVVAIKTYKGAVSPLLPPSCRFSPTCSSYAVEALTFLPAYHALFLITKRILKCNPLFKGGFDPVKR
tara:strand:+ start:299 stop:544 length:246 start_codon:yes stop_codon:yes gene_type:complete